MTPQAAATIARRRRALDIAREAVVLADFHLKAGNRDYLQLAAISSAEEWLAEARKEFDQ